MLSTILLSQWSLMQRVNLTIFAECWVSQLSKVGLSLRGFAVWWVPYCITRRAVKTPVAHRSNKSAPLCFLGPEQFNLLHPHSVASSAHLHAIRRDTLVFQRRVERLVRSSAIDKSGTLSPYCCMGVAVTRLTSTTCPSPMRGSDPAEEQ